MPSVNVLSVLLLSVIMLSVIMLRVIMLSVTMLSVAFNLMLCRCYYAECHYDECRYDECCYAECFYAECRGPTDKQSSLFRTFSKKKRFYNIALKWVCQFEAETTQIKLSLCITLVISAVVEHLPHHRKVKGSCSAAADVTWREK